MKHFFTIAALIFLASCGGSDDKKVSTTTENEDGSRTKTDVSVKGIQTKADELNAKLDALKKLTPLTIEQMKTMLPEEFEGVKRSNYNAASNFGYTFVGAEYEKNNKTQLDVKLYDCAGENGAIFYSSTFWSNMDFQQEDDKEYTKSVDFMGGRAIERFNKERNETTITYLVNDRVLVTLDGRNMNPDEVKAAAQKLNFKIS
jgi:hypothetical protein